MKPRLMKLPGSILPALANTFEGSMTGMLMIPAAPAIAFLRKLRLLCLIHRWADKKAWSDSPQLAAETKSPELTLGFNTVLFDMILYLFSRTE
jgi:hypothetical protein